MTWGVLGDIQFQVDEAPRSFRHKEGTQFAEHARLGQKSTLQNVGEQLQTLDLSFRFAIGWCDPDEQLQRLRDARTAAQPMPLILGRGIFSGNYVVTTVNTTLEQTSAEGQTELIEVSVVLKETTDLPEPSLLLLTQASPFEVRA